MYLEGNFVIPTGIWFVPEDMPFFKEMAKGDIRDISSLSKCILGKMGMGENVFTSEFILKALLRKAKTMFPYASWAAALSKYLLILS